MKKETDMENETWDTGLEIWDLGSETRDTGLETPDLRCRIQDSFAGYKFDDVIRMHEEEVKAKQKVLEKLALEEARRKKRDAGRGTRDMGLGTRDAGHGKEKEEYYINFPFTIKDLVKRGNDNFYSDSKNNPKIYAGLSETAYVGVPVSLEKCLAWAQPKNGVVATMPYLVAGLSVAQPSNYLRQRWHTALSEENAGIDKKGKFARGKPVVVVVHGGGILTPDRIRTAYREGLTPQNAAKFKAAEFESLLDGVLPSGESIDLYTVDDVKKGKIKNPFVRYGIIVDYEKAKATSSGYQDKASFLSNDLVIARAGTLDHLEKYFDNIQSGDTVGNWHRFSEVDPKQPQGHVLVVSDDKYGLGGNSNLVNGARFVGVAPKEKPITRNKPAEQKIPSTIKQLISARDKYFMEKLK